MSTRQNCIPMFCGFVRGRRRSSNIVGIDTPIEEFLCDPAADPGMVLLDIQAAFPSIDGGASVGDASDGGRGVADSCEVSDV